jgi:hypothetical protein
MVASDMPAISSIWPTETPPYRSRMSAAQPMQSYVCEFRMCARASLKCAQNHLCECGLPLACSMNGPVPSRLQACHGGAKLFRRPLLGLPDRSNGFTPSVMPCNSKLPRTARKRTANAWHQGIVCLGAFQRTRPGESLMGRGRTLRFTSSSTVDSARSSACHPARPDRTVDAAQHPARHRQGRRYV